jgi:hypothetical protein
MAGKKRTKLDMVDEINWELRMARSVASLIGALDLERFGDDTETLEFAAAAIETHIDAAREAMGE